ncbi:cytochrome c biogenesis CcdA family protein [Kineococcus siccus]|uniref:cytochrome c biogenesis CcdA family protein n=1 Tax=Kineococcus siccus TaxID=2696567 RepID=UPI001F0D6B93|nr:cytochrome c biogenesis CcdA family protein [Kineococcus siccus]
MQTVVGGPLALAVPLAVLAGLVSFLSPCVLPLVPGFLGYVTGLGGVDLEDRRRGRMAAGAALFVVGFSAVFVLISFTAGSVGAALAVNSRDLQRVLGVFVLAMAALVLAEPLWAQREVKVRWRPRAGLLGAPVLGAVFGLGWTPCIGPIFSAIVALGFSSASQGRSTGLAVAYCLGLGLPFVLLALGFSRGMRVLAVFRRHRRAINRFGGVLLVVIGVLLVSGAFDAATQLLQGPISGFEPVI